MRCTSSEGRSASGRRYRHAGLRGQQTHSLIEKSICSSKKRLTNILQTCGAESQFICKTELCLTAAAPQFPTPTASSTPALRHYCSLSGLPMMTASAIYFSLEGALLRRTSVKHLHGGVPWPVTRRRMWLRHCLSPRFLTGSLTGTAPVHLCTLERGRPTCRSLVWREGYYDVCSRQSRFTGTSTGCTSKSDTFVRIPRCQALLGILGRREGLDTKGLISRTLMTDTAIATRNKDLCSVFAHSSSSSANVDFGQDAKSNVSSKRNERPTDFKQPLDDWHVDVSVLPEVAAKGMQRLWLSTSPGFVTPLSVHSRPFMYFCQPSALTLPGAVPFAVSTAFEGGPGLLDTQAKVCSAFFKISCDMEGETRCTSPSQGSQYDNYRETGVLNRGMPPLVAPKGCGDMLCNKVRNDKKDRKRAYPQRGFWKKQHFLQIKNESTRLAFAVQGVDLLKLKSLAWGEVRKGRRGWQVDECYASSAPVKKRTATSADKVSEGSSIDATPSTQ